MKRLLVVVLFAFLITVLFVLPASADTTITSASVTITEPAAGASPSYKVSLSSNVHYYSDSYNTTIYHNDISWKDLTDDRTLLVDSDIFAAGHQYQVTIYLTADEGYAFNSSTTGKINGKTANTRILNNQLELTYDFPAVKDPISSVSITIAAPAIGASPDYSPVLDNTTYYSAAYNNKNFQNDVAWSNYTAHDTIMAVSEASFELGNQYKVIVYLTPQTGYSFTDNATAKVNGKTASADLRSSGQLCVTYVFPALTEPITEAHVTIIEPHTDYYPDYHPTFSVNSFFSAQSSDDNYKNDVAWYDITADAYVPVSNGHFQYDHEYRVIIRLTPKEGYSFSSGTDARINGETANTTVLSDGRLRMTRQFEVKKNKIDYISIDIEEPVAGRVPSRSPKMGDNEEYYVASKDDVIWYDKTDGVYLGGTDKFKVGHAYECQVWVTASYGYEFLPDEETSCCFCHDYTGTYLAANGQLQATHDFPELKTPISSVSITITPPSAGSTPDYNAMLPSGNHYSLHNYSDNTAVNGVWWMKQTEDLSFKYVEKSETYKIGEYYMVKFWLDAESGYTFTHYTAAKVNGETAILEQHDGNYSVIYDFPALSDKPVITKQPSSVTVAAGKTATFKVTATGSGLTYQWYYKKPGDSSWSQVKVNGTSATYSLATEARHSGNKYRCKVTNSGGSVYSSTATLTVVEKPAVTTQPANKTVVEGKTATFTVAASGGGLSYQWYYRKPGETTWNKVTTNGTGATYSLKTEARHNGYTYHCVVKNAAGSVTSSNAKLTVTPGITTQPSNQTVAAGKTATFKVVATGTGLTYQWYYQKSGESTWNKVSVNGTSATYSLTTEARHSGNKYRCLVTNSGGGSVYSSTATLTVAEKPAITTQPGAKTVVEGKTATFKVAASGGGLSYQWYYRKPGETTWNKVTTNGTGATYSLKTEARHNGYTYHCVVKNTAGSVTSSNAKLTVTPGITTQPGNQTVAAGKTATFKVVATGTGLTYQWYYQKSGESTWNKVSTNGTSATYSLATEARHSGNKYRCLVTNSGGGSVYSNTVTLTVTAKPAITTQPSSKTVTAGAKATFKVVASGTGLSYQWYYQKPGESTWNKVSTNGTSATYSLTTEARHNGYQYKCTVSNTAGSVTSKVVKLTVK